MFGWFKAKAPVPRANTARINVVQRKDIDTGNPYYALELEYHTCGLIHPFSLHFNTRYKQKRYETELHASMDAVDALAELENIEYRRVVNTIV